MTFEELQDLLAEQFSCDTGDLTRSTALEDLAGATVFLASPASAYVTGQTLAVDGGFTAK